MLGERTIFVERGHIVGANHVFRASQNNRQRNTAPERAMLKDRSKWNERALEPDRSKWNERDTTNDKETGQMIEPSLVSEPGG
jgi:hypothetical protein